MLSALGHTVLVERPADYFGVDLYLKLVEQTGKTIALTGHECAFQCKSDKKAVEIKTDESRLALYELRQPLFIAVINKATLEMSIFQTVSRYSAFWTYPKAAAYIKFETPKHGMPFMPKGQTSINYNDASPASIDIFTGAPIIKISLAQLDSAQSGPKLIQQCKDILAKWIEVDNQANAWRTASVAAAPFIDGYQTNQVPAGPPQALFFGREPELARQLQTLKALLRLTHYSAEFPTGLNPATGGSVTQQHLKSIQEGIEHLETVLDSVAPAFPPTTTTEPFFTYTLPSR